MAIISSWLAILASVTVSALALPTTPNAGPNTALLMPRGAEGEPFTCPDPTGTAAAKSKLIQYGAQSVDLAIAMLENGCAFTAAFSVGNNKQEDSAEIGVYRNNWHMLRTYCDHFKGASSNDWYNLGQQAHNDVEIATRCQRQIWDTLGADQFFALQRGGLSNKAAGHSYGQYVWQYNGFCQADGGQHMNDGMAVYWNVVSM